MPGKDGGVPSVFSGSILLLPGTHRRARRHAGSRRDARSPPGGRPNTNANVGQRRRPPVRVFRINPAVAGNPPPGEKDQPAAHAELLATIGSSEFHLGHLDSAEKLLREALRIRIQTDGANSPIAAGILNDLGLVRKHQDHPDDAERLLRESLAIREKSLGHANGATARGLFDLASILAMRGKNTEAEAAYRETLRLRETLLASGDKTIEPTVIPLTMHGLGQHLARMNRLPEAESLMRRALTLRRRL
jgi:tetratricopeptide (TPR) repeat protein